MDGATPLAAHTFPITHAALLDLKLRVFGLHSLQDGLAFFQGQAEIFEMRLVHIAPDKENLSSRRNAIHADKFRQYLHLNNSRHRPASSLENPSLHDLTDPQLFPTPPTRVHGAAYRQASSPKTSWLLAEVATLATDEPPNSDRHVAEQGSEGHAPVSCTGQRQSAMRAVSEALTHH